MSIGELIVRGRREKHMSQEVLAKRVGICRSSLGLYERDVLLPSIDVLSKISIELGIPISMFLVNNKDSYKDKERVFIRLLREEDELYNKVMNNPQKEIKKWKRYSKIDSTYIK